MDLVDREAQKETPTLGALDLTGPGPFTDAVLRYLVVRYGVTPDQLRNIKGPVRVGDVL
jgi:alpha 1,6-mannosyltransferase